MCEVCSGQVDDRPCTSKEVAQSLDTDGTGVWQVGPGVLQVLELHMEEEILIGWANPGPLWVSPFEDSGQSRVGGGLAEETHF